MAEPAGKRGISDCGGTPWRSLVFLFSVPKPKYSDTAEHLLGRSSKTQVFFLLQFYETQTEFEQDADKYQRHTYDHGFCFKRVSEIYN